MTLKAKIEATLFATGSALSINEIAEVVGASEEHIEEALLELIMDYSARDGALEIDDEDGYIIQVKEEHFDIVEKLMPIEMGESTLKTLSAIAIKQPVLQSEMVTLVGMSAYDHISSLLERNLISKKPQGKSFILKTTPRFNEYFKLTGDTKTLAQILEIQAKN
ncbi:MAG: SMC-Scp complex subunit ScpB [Vampirovibrionia bacterium]